MPNILDKIIATKRQEVLNAKDDLPLSELAQFINTDKPLNSLATALQSKPGIITEFKRASPSKGVIRASADPASIVDGYDRFGAVAVSVLTDSTYFKGQELDFAKARAVTSKPILRKEFIIDEYQIYESKQMGADVILLIAAVLTKQEIKNFTLLAQQLKLDVLIELHTINEIDKLCGMENVIGVNNRNLKTFEVDILQSIIIKKELGEIDAPLISESGLSSISEVAELLSQGFRGFLMGEYFMKQEDTIKAFEKFNHSFQQLIK